MTMRKQPLYQALASCVDARLNCLSHHECLPHLTEWIERHRERADKLARDWLPSGSGVDAGTTIDYERSSGERLVFNTSYRHMNDGGYYDGWTEHTVTITASLIHTLNIKISGRDRNGIKSYLHETFDLALRATVEE